MKNKIIYSFFTPDKRQAIGEDENNINFRLKYSVGPRFGSEISNWSSYFN